MEWDGLGEILADIADREGWTFHGPRPDAVAAFEAEHGVVIPEPYRSFVCEVASGLDTDCMQLARFAADELARPGEAFPYDAAYGAAIVDALSGGRTLAAIAADATFATRQVRALPPGCLVIGELDGTLSVLALSGDERGRVWQVGDFDLPETRHRHAADGDNTRLDFAGWLACFFIENGLTREVSSGWKTSQLTAK